MVRVQDVASTFILAPDVTLQFKYNLLSKENGEQFGLSACWWQNHPDWKWFARTNIKLDGKYLGGGGATPEAAIAHAAQSVSLNAGPSLDFHPDGVAIIGEKKAEGTETKSDVRTL